ncbi:hypothetical protein Hdeb2414_s0011g00365111 [Helianthus debilis subsp. tardiflorus]
MNSRRLQVFCASHGSVKPLPSDARVQTLIKEFWDLEKFVEIDGKEIIHGQVNKLDVDAFAEVLNYILRLRDDPNAPYSVPIMCQRGCLLRMKCVNDILGGQINKAWLPLRYKFLLHILIQCLSNRRSGYDMASNDLVGMLVSLVLNNPFSISKYIFANIKENLGRTGADNDVLKIDAMMEHSLKIFRGVASKRYTESTPPRKIFGALANTAYVAPTNDKWRHDDRHFDDEKPKLKKMIEDKFGQKKLRIFGDIDDESDNGDDDDEGGDGGNVGASGTSVPGGDNDESDSDDNPPEPGYTH